MLKPILQYQNYFFKNDKKLYGIDEQGIKEVEVIDQDGEIIPVNDFFISGGTIYLSVNEVETITDGGETITETLTNFYEQKAGVIKSIASLPVKPELKRSTLSNSEFEVYDFDYKGTACTDVKNLSAENVVERFLMVDGVSYFPTIGLYFHVKEGRGQARENGLYFWPVGEVGVLRLDGVGEVW